MVRVNVRRVGFAASIGLLVAFWGGVAMAPAAPPGPRLAMVKFKEPERTQLLTVDALGGSQETLLSVSAWKAMQAVDPFSAPSWSPDGTRIAFTTTAEETGRFVYGTTTKLALISVDGGDVKPIPGTNQGREPVFSPDGRSIAFAKELVRHRLKDRGGTDHEFESTSIWLANLSTGKLTQLTRWRDGRFQYPASFSPDGTRLALSSFDGSRPPRALEIGLTGSTIRVLVRNAYEPVYSPDGQTIAVLSGPVKELKRHFPPNWHLLVTARMTDIFIGSVLGGGLRRLTDTRAAAEGAPRWDPSGERLAYTEWRPFGSPSDSLHQAEATALGFGEGVREINADGTCSTEVFSEPTSQYYAAVWQPGVGREAGPINC